MGFGLLFVGYFMTYLMSVSYAGYLIRFVGYALMLASFRKLNRYNVSFNLPLYASFLALGVTAVGCYAEVGQFLYNSLIIEHFSLSESFLLTLGTIDDVAVFVLHAALLFALRQIARETGLDELSYAAARNFVFICIYEVLVAISYLPFAFVEDYKRYFSMPIYLFYFAWIILDLVLIFKCYANICDEGDVDMPLKKSRFAFVNKLREETARREQKAADESVEYAKRKLEQRREKRMRKKR